MVGVWLQGEESWWGRSHRHHMAKPQLGLRGRGLLKR